MAMAPSKEKVVAQSSYCVASDVVTDLPCSCVHLHSLIDQRYEVVELKQLN